jgi:hypothetical protein
MSVHLYTVMLMVQLYDYICTLWCWCYSCMTVHLYTVMLMVQMYDCTFVHCNVDGTVVWLYICNSHTTVPSTSQCTNVVIQLYHQHYSVQMYSHTTVPSTLQCTNVVIQLYHQHHSVQMYSHTTIPSTSQCTNVVIQLYHQHYSVQM